MFKWIADNIGTIIVLAVLVAIVAFVIIKMVKDKKRGKSSCGCNCAGCAMSESCHNKTAPDKKE